MLILYSQSFFMKKQFFFLIPAIVLALFVSSCGKDEEPPVVKTKTQLLTQSSWRFKSASASGIDISNQAPPFDPCRKDNILTFTAAGAGTIDEGATKCAGGDPQTSPVTWSFLSSETMLRISAPLFPNTGNDFTLVSLSETELVVSIGYAPPVGATILVTITFNH
jgi:hypothetical protein